MLFYCCFFWQTKCLILLIDAAAGVMNIFMHDHTFTFLHTAMYYKTRLATCIKAKLKQSDDQKNRVGYCRISFILYEN